MTVVINLKRVGLIQNFGPDNFGLKIWTENLYRNIAPDFTTSWKWSEMTLDQFGMPTTGNYW